MQPQPEPWNGETSQAYAGLLQAFDQASENKHPRMLGSELSRQLAIRELINHMAIPPSSNTQKTVEYPSFNQCNQPNSRDIGSPPHSMPISTASTVLWANHPYTGAGLWLVPAMAQPLPSHFPVRTNDTCDAASVPRRAESSNDTISNVIPSIQAQLDHLPASYDIDKQQNTLADGSIGSFLRTPASMTQPPISTWQENVSLTKSHKTNNNKVQQSRKCRPKRALTAYNIFFKEERERILSDIRRQDVYASVGNRHDTGSKRNKDGGTKVQSCSIGFKEMGKIIGLQWKELDSAMRLVYEKRAKVDKKRYNEELAQYVTNARNEREAKLASLQASVSEETKERYFSSRN